MANHPKPFAKNEQGEYATFLAALKKVGFFIITD